MAKFISGRSKVTPLLTANNRPNPCLTSVCKIDLFFCRGPIYDTLENQLSISPRKVIQKSLQSQCEQVAISLFGERLGRTDRRPSNRIIRLWETLSSKL